ncbi:MAG: hypothetical protein AAGB19_10110, partial [Cyanobacteria bacterium P01_F01_bin.3]
SEPNKYVAPERCGTGTLTLPKPFTVTQLAAKVGARHRLNLSRGESFRQPAFEDVLVEGCTRPYTPASKIGPRIDIDIGSIVSFRGIAFLEPTHNKRLQLTGFAGS